PRASGTGNVLCCPARDPAQVRPRVLLHWLAMTLILAGVACGPKPAAEEPGRAAPSVIGRHVDLTLPSLDGDEVNFACFRGRPVVVHFSTTGSLLAQVDLEELRRVSAARRSLQVVEVTLIPANTRHHH